MKLDDKIRIQHMIDSIEEAFEFVKGKSFSDFTNNRMLVLSLIKEIEIIGEAASKITQDLKDVTTEIPWSDIISMRNRLIHGYFDVDLDILWNTIMKDLPLLKDKLIGLLKGY